ncbi:hypothetical protein A7A08_01648 [Methyloligella halotolerans]|uniref:Uncharacterized protein n=1 Tax=Methyloligella halotolerans TaxID=1177755 RepID=A0A1E2RZH6_9HYPH|nr:hypothetical protein [Methyloligella halotolerans]ODA67614.1 hypothetical protein A7A08_01648 [Methyloligella halotolerans]
MVLGVSLQTFTLIHVVISLIGIAAGLLTLFAMITSEQPSRWTGLFLWSTLLTSITGFLFPVTTLTPAIIVGIITTTVVAIALASYYLFHLRGHWRWIYVASALFALYLNCFVGVVQSFQKIGPLNMLAPNGNEPPFMAAQGALLLAFLMLGYLALRRFHPERALGA